MTDEWCQTNYGCEAYKDYCTDECPEEQEKTKTCAEEKVELEAKVKDLEAQVEELKKDTCTTDKTWRAKKKTAKLTSKATCAKVAKSKKTCSRSKSQDGVTARKACGCQCDKFFK